MTVYVIRFTQLTFMSFNSDLAHNISRYLNLYKDEQADNSVLHVIIHVGYELARTTHVPTHSTLYKFLC